MKGRLLTIVLLVFLGLTLSSKADHDPEIKIWSSWDMTMEVYPNPTSDLLFIKFNGTYSDELHFEVINFIGNPVQVRPRLHDTNTYQLDVSQLNNGYYYLIVKDLANDKKLMKKFLKK